MFFLFQPLKTFAPMTIFRHRKNLVSDTCPFLDENTSRTEKYICHMVNQPLLEEIWQKSRFLVAKFQNPKISLCLQACEAAG